MNLFRNFSIKFFSLTFLVALFFVLAPLNSAKAVYITNIDCGENGTGTISKCAMSATLNKTSYNPGEHIDGQLWVQNSGDPFTVEGPNDVTIDNKASTRHSVSGGTPYLTADTLNGSFNAPAQAGCYTMSFWFKWKEYGEYSSSISVPYAVSPGVCGATGGGGSSGSGSVPAPVITFSASTPVTFGSPTTLTWDANPAKNCSIVTYTPSSTITVMLNGSISGNTTYVPTKLGINNFEITCENNDDPNSLPVGLLQKSDKHFVENIFNSFKKLAAYVLPKVFASSVTPGGYNYAWSSATANVNVTSTPPAPIANIHFSPLSPIPSGTLTVVSWNSINATECHLTSPADSMPKTGLSLSFSSGIRTADTVFTVQCTNSVNAYTTATDTLVVTTPNPTNFPDLTASVPTPTNAIAGAAKTYSSIITNGGDASTGTDTFTNLFQIATGLNGEEPIGLVNYEAPGMNPIGVGLTGVATKSISFPTAGTYYMRVCADNNASMVGTIDEGTNEGNNCSSPWTLITVNPVTQKPDLIVVGNVSPTVATVNVEQTFSSTVKNQGNVATGPTGSKFYNFFQVTDVNPNSAPTGGGAMLENKFKNFFSYFTTSKVNASMGLIDLPKSSMTVLGANSSKIASVTYTFDTVGPYWMRACADKSDRNTFPGDVDEISELNNCGIWTQITVSNDSQKPDLTAGNVTPTTAVVGGKGTNFFSTIANIGNASTGTGFTNLIQVSASENGTNPQSFTKAMGIVGAGSFSTMSFSRTFTTTGTYFVRVCADKNSATNAGVIDESDETNNCSDWTQIDVTANTNTPTGALTATDCFIPLNENGCETTLDWSITNPISGANTAVTTTPPDNTTVPNTDPTTGTTTYPVSKGPGSRAFFLYHNGVQLATATSNSSCVKGTLWDEKQATCAGDILTPPDLIASAVAPSSINVGDDIYFSALITNQGNTSTVAPFVNLFQIADKADENGDGVDPRFFSSAMVSPYLDGNSSQPITSKDSYTFKEPGTIYMRACADNDADFNGKIAESDEKNNCGPWTAITSIVALPDLTVGITDPPAIPVGQEFNFSAIVTNQGDVSTGGEFANHFQLSDMEGGQYVNVEDINPYVTLDTLDAHSSATLTSSDPYIFNEAAEKYVRACVDITTGIQQQAQQQPVFQEQMMVQQQANTPSNTPSNTANDPGVIVESNEGNNCGPWAKITAFSDPKDGVCLPEHYGCVLGDSTKNLGSGTPSKPWTWVCAGWNKGKDAECSEVSNIYCMDPNATNYAKLGVCEYDNCVPTGSCDIANCPPCNNGNGNGNGNGGGVGNGSGGKKPIYIER